MKVGVIGTGSMGQNHARVYSEIGELVGVSDVDKDAAKKIASRFGTQWYTDYRELLKTDVEAVTISVPTNRHHQIGLDALNAGKHILIEKPISSSINEGRALVDKAEEVGCVLAIGHIERHNPVVKFAKKILDDGDFGEVITATARRVSAFPVRIRDVGVILDLSIHDIDVMRYLIGTEVESVYALGGVSNSSTFESYANILLNFKNGISGFVEANWLTPMKVRKLWLTCSKNFVELDYINQSVQISSSTVMEYDVGDLYRIPYEYDIRDISLKKQEPLKNELLDFISAIENRHKPLVDGAEGLETLIVGYASLASYKSGHKVHLDEFKEGLGG